MRTQQKALFLTALACGFIGACSLTGPVRDDPKAAGVNFETPNAARWENLKDRADADHAWVNQKSGATLAVRSVCGRYEHLSLRALSQNLINIVQDPETQSEQDLTLAGRAALSTTFKGNVDGVEIQSRLVVVRKDTCIFDFTLSELPVITPDVMKDFDTFLTSFRYEGATAK